MGTAISRAMKNWVSRANITNSQSTTVDELFNHLKKITLSAWMKLAMDLFQPLLIHMRVNLGRRDVGVP